MTIILLLLTICGGQAFADSAAVFDPKLMILNLQRQLDTTTIVFGSDSLSTIPGIKKITADSAKIISPPAGSVLSGDNIAYEIEPMMPVDSVMLFVRHSQTLTDTLGVIASPPYKAAWNAAGVPSQDQIHLQFGYVLYCPDDAVVTSKPLPHRWALDRGMRPSGKVCKINPVSAAEFSIDGNMEKWDRVEGFDIGGGARFKALWSGSRLFFAVQARGGPVTNGDFVELHVDMHRDRAKFSGINHRSIRFAPLSGKRTSFVADLDSGKFAYSDSVNALLNNEIVWKAVMDEDGGGYAIEAAIPFVILADIAFPPAKFGLDVSVMSAGRDAETASFHSWAGAGRFTRYSPHGWGTVQVTQTASMFKYLFLIMIALSCTAVLAFTVHTTVTERKNAKMEQEADDDKGSPTTEAAVKCIEDGLSNVDFRISDVLKPVGKTREEIISSIQKDLGITFEQLLAFKRIKRSQSLMKKDPETPIEKIAELCGFANVEAYRKQYKSQMMVDPEVSRAALLEKLREEQESEEDDEDD